MAYIAVIVESPAKCSKIESFLGPGYKCMASFGHIRTIDHINCIAVDDNFTPTFKVIDGKTRQIKTLSSFIGKATEVILATDDDREGEAIAWHICEHFKLDVATTKRIVFHEITQQAIKTAVENHTIINMNIVKAQQARQILDLVVGFKLSPVLWGNISYKTDTPLSAGRCQTPALRLIYENQKDVDAATGVKTYNTVGYFTSHNLGFELNYNHDNEAVMKQFLIESSSFEHVYSCGDVRPVIKKQPLPYNTSSLQQACSSGLKMSPKATMMSCQKLYEAGYITYMRTDSNSYSEEFVVKAKEFIHKTYGEEFILQDSNKLSEKIRDEPVTAHEAIRPTDICIETVEKSESIGEKEMKVYLIIRRNTLESCMAPANCVAVTASICAPQQHEYKYSAENIIFAGWKIVGGRDKPDTSFSFIQLLKAGRIEYKKISSKVSMKHLKSHCTEANLVQLLEQRGIGRPSTFASLIDKIQDRGYVKKTDIVGKKFNCVDYELQQTMLTETNASREFGGEKGKLVIQPVGIIVIEFLLKHFDALFNYDYTKNMEDMLDVVAKGNHVWHDICRNCYDDIERLSKGLYSGRTEAIKIDDNHTYMIAKYGPVIKCVEGDKTTFKKVREDIDLEKMREGGYTVAELFATKPATNGGRLLGNHIGKDVVLKQSKFGTYVEWGDSKINIKTDGDSYGTTELCDVVDLLVTPIILEISPDASIRRGEYGTYVYYKTGKMKKPKFISLDSSIAFTCSVDEAKSWLRKKHNIVI